MTKELPSCNYKPFCFFLFHFWKWQELSYLLFHEKRLIISYKPDLHSKNTGCVAQEEIQQNCNIHFFSSYMLISLLVTMVQHIFPAWSSEFIAWICSTDDGRGWQIFRSSSYFSRLKLLSFMSCFCLALNLLW